jgi:flavin reductase (DIM6/NTAB) family NADH-FMN oxidoreductase RutF
MQGTFRDAMRRLAATVTIISTRSGGIRHGMTATAVTSLSVDPPSLLVCVNKTGKLHQYLSDSDRFCVNLLHSEQAALSEAFAGNLVSEERFRHGDWAEEADGLPYLADAQANIFCVKVETIAHASHSIFIGEVERVENAPQIRPLIFSNGEYGRYMPLSTVLSV